MVSPKASERQMRQKRNHRVPAAGTRARIRGLDTPVVNLSLGGACLVVAEGVAQQDARFPLELGHPHVPEKAALQAEVVWTTADDGSAKAGVRSSGGWMRGALGRPKERAASSAIVRRSPSACCRSRS